MKNKTGWISILVILFVILCMANKGEPEKINLSATGENIKKEVWNKIPGSNIVDAVEFFDDQKIYQDNKEVGTVVGNPQENQGSLIFSKIYNTENLQQDKPIKFRKMRCKITYPPDFATQEMKVTLGGVNGSERKVENYQNVLNGVVCQKIN